MRRAILKKSGERSPKAPLELKYTKTLERSPKLGNNWDDLRWLSSVDRNIIATPKCPRLRTETRTTGCGQKMVQEIAAWQWAKKKFTEFAERTWRAELHSSNRYGIGTSINLNCQFRRQNFLLILVHQCT